MTGLDRSTAVPGFFGSAWPCECGGPRRQKTTSLPGLGLGTGGRLTSTIRQTGRWAVMLVQRGPGELYLQGGAPPFQADESFGWLERINPITLEPTAASPLLPSGGHNWCGGVVVHVNGDLYMVNGRFCHRLSPGCDVVAERELPVDGAYNGLLVASDGNILTKNIQWHSERPTFFSVLDPESLEPVAEPFALPENSVGRFSIDRGPDGEVVYVSSDTKLYRLRYDGGELALDDWVGDYDVPGQDQRFAWDTCLGADSVWMMDMGEVPGARALLEPFPVGTGLLDIDAPAGEAAQRVFRFSVTNPAERDVLVPFGLPRGAIPAPPLFDQDRSILVAFDTNNGMLGAWRYDGPGELSALWQRDLTNTLQPLLYSDTGELVVEDRGSGDSDAVVVDITSGVELGRSPIGALTAGGMFICPGFARDFYVASITGAVTRVSVVA